MADTDLYPESKRDLNSSSNQDKTSKGKDRTSLSQKILDIFTTGKSNEEILNKCNQVSKANLVKILRQYCEKIVTQIEKLISKDHQIIKGREYEARRKIVVDQLAGDRRVDQNAPTLLGNSALKHFFKICKRYIFQGSLKSCNLQLLIRLHKKWFHCQIEKQIVEIESKQKNDLLRKKEQVQKLRIQEQILKRKAEILKIQMEIEQLEESLNKKGKRLNTFCKQQERFSEEDIQQKEKQISNVKNQSKPFKQKPISNKVIPNYLDQQFQDKQRQDTNKSKITKLAQNKTIKPSQKVGIEVQGGGWKLQQQKYLLNLLTKFNFREQSTLINEMEKRFGKQTKFQASFFRVKKYEMYRKCGQDFLKAVNQAKIASDNEFQALSNHFNTIDNLKAYQFQTQFVRKYYFSNFNTFPHQTLLEIVSIVWNQPTRVLKTNYLEKKSYLFNKKIENKTNGQQEDEKGIKERKKEINPPAQRRKALKQRKGIDVNQLSLIKKEQSQANYEFDEQLFKQAFKDIINHDQ